MISCIYTSTGPEYHFVQETSNMGERDGCDDDGGSSTCN